MQNLGGPAPSTSPRNWSTACDTVTAVTTAASEFSSITLSSLLHVYSKINSLWNSKKHSHCHIQLGRPMFVCYAVSVNFYISSHHHQSCFYTYIFYIAYFYVLSLNLVCCYYLRDNSKTNKDVSLLVVIQGGPKK